PTVSGATHPVPRDSAQAAPHDTGKAATPARRPEGSGAERAKRSGGGRSERRCSFGPYQASARNAPPGGVPASRLHRRSLNRGLRRSHGKERDEESRLKPATGSVSRRSVAGNDAPGTREPVFPVVVPEI